ncbi:MAG TPA: NUDIX domain-containing protein [Methylomirabilota bacterium]|nr:NUDIX domain-containing protein [Methylomirabilota bacterium]
MAEEILHRGNNTLIRRQRLALGESTPWHHDHYHRVTLVLSGDAITIEYRDGRPEKRLSVRPGQVDWDEPTTLVHRGMNVGRQPYEEIALFLLDDADAHPQPRVDEGENHRRPSSGPERTGEVCGRSTLTPVGPGGNAGQDVVGVSSVVHDADGRILLIKTPEAGWELPGGQVKQGEDLTSALLREVREETGCQIEVGRLTSVTVRTGVPRLTVLTFICRHIVGEPRPGDDSLEVGWFASDTAVALVTHPVELLRLTDTLAERDGVVYRAYRRVATDNQQHETYEVLDFHRW